MGLQEKEYPPHFHDEPPVGQAQEYIKTRDAAIGANQDGIPRLDAEEIRRDAEGSAQVSVDRTRFPEEGHLRAGPPVEGDGPLIHVERLEEHGSRLILRPQGIGTHDVLGDGPQDTHGNGLPLCRCSAPLFAAMGAGQSDCQRENTQATKTPRQFSHPQLPLCPWKSIPLPQGRRIQVARHYSSRSNIMTPGKIPDPSVQETLSSHPASESCDPLWFLE